MPIYASAYDTKIGRAMDITRIKRDVEDVQVASRILTLNYDDYMHGAGNDEENARGGLLTHGTTAETLIRHANFPIHLNDPLALVGNKNKKIVVADVRPFMTQSRTEAGRCRVVNTMEFELNRVLVAANLAWINKGTQVIMGMGDVMQKVYCRWLAGTIRNRFELAPFPALKVRVLAAYFFQCLFIDSETLTDNQKRSMIASACRSASADFNTHEAMLADVGVVKGIDDFIVLVKEKVDDAIQLDGLDGGILLERMMSTWFGFDGRMLAAAAVEHPPTFAALLYMSYGQQGYRKALLSQVSEEYRGNKGGSDFLRNMQLQLGLA